MSPASCLLKAMVCVHPQAPTAAHCSGGKSLRNSRVFSEHNQDESDAAASATFVEKLWDFGLVFHDLLLQSELLGSAEFMQLATILGVVGSYALTVILTVMYQKNDADCVCANNEGNGVDGGEVCGCKKPQVDHWMYPLLALDLDLVKPSIEHAVTPRLDDRCFA